MTTRRPSHIYGEEILRREWWLHAILVGVWRWNVVVSGSVVGWIFGTTLEFWEQNPEVPISAKATPQETRRARRSAAARPRVALLLLQAARRNALRSALLPRVARRSADTFHAMPHDRVCSTSTLHEYK